MRTFFQAALAVPVAGAMIASSFLVAPAQAWRIRVSQESAVGIGDFDTNVLGFIETFQTTDTLAGFYNYSGGSFNGPVDINSNATQNFFVHGSDGLGFYTVHDDIQDGSNGSARMEFNLLGDPDGATFLLGDEPTENLSTTGGTNFITRHFWGPCCTDGTVIGSLDGTDWELFAEFRTLPTGIDDWLALSADGSGRLL